MGVQRKVLPVVFYGFFYRIGKFDFYGVAARFSAYSIGAGPTYTIVGNEVNKDWLIWLLSLTENHIDGGDSCEIPDYDGQLRRFI